MKLICPLTQNTLTEKIVHYEYPSLRVDCLYVDDEDRGFYPRINGVIYLSEKFFAVEELSKISVTGLSSIIEKDSLDWYTDYQNGLAKFKYDFFTEKFKKHSRDYSLRVLDYISADGNLLRHLKENSDNSLRHCFVALDLDFHALAKLHLKDPTIICICCDATKKCFSDDQFDLIFSNSMHHIPEGFEEAINNITKILSNNGSFYGIESQGVFAEIVIRILSVIPKRLVPYKFSEIYNERTLLKKWLNTSLQKRCKNISNYQEIQRRLFHVTYRISRG